jgi:tRNA U34 5-methylaminomethyl-2-thiouridine-forming methyltransferase MnmC
MINTAPLVSANIPYKLVRLASGTFSVHSTAESETFHPVIGPVAEAEALYVRQLGIRDRVQAHHGDFVIWDVGLGAAANVLTVLNALQDLEVSLKIISFDRTIEPLKFALDHADELGYFAGHETLVRRFVEGGSVLTHCGKSHLAWSLELGDFPAALEALQIQRLPKPSAILFDAYSPAKNPTMWTQPLFARIFSLLDPKTPCAMPTYSRSTMLRVSLLLAGFYVGVGHATGEKEETTIAANSLSLINEPLDRIWLIRARKSTSAEPLWEPVYRQAPLRDETWAKLQAHPQFA